MHADSQDVVFPYGPCLALAAQLWALADHITTVSQPQRDSAAKTALEGWEGRYATLFSQHMTVSDTDGRNVAANLQTTANGLAAQWAEAKFQQAQIDYARAVQNKKDSESWTTEASNYVFGDSTNYGSPPAHPPEIPHGPAFAPTAVPRGTYPS